MSSVEDLADAAQLASLADETPEGRSIVVLAKREFNLRGRELADTDAQFIPFSAQTRMSGVDLGGRKIRKGAADSGRQVRARQWRHGAAGTRRASSSGSRKAGGTPLVVAENAQVLGVIHLKDIIKEGIRSASRGCARWACAR